MKEVLLITPPFTQLNTPYPATAYLKGFLNTLSIPSYQMDLGIEVILELFTKARFEQIFEEAKEQGRIHSNNALRIYALRDSYLQTLEDIITFLQGKNDTFARQICSDNFLPQASRFEQLDDLDWAFGVMGIQDKAKHLATLYLEDLSDFLIECVDDKFGFSRYAERLGMSANSFDELYEHLQAAPSFIDQISLAILEKKVTSINPTLVLISVPFPGNLYSAFRCAQWIKTHFPDTKISMGGGFPNTELRSLTDVRVFEFFDYITLDDGELPVSLLTSNIFRPTTDNPDYGYYKRTFLIEDQKVVYKNNSSKRDFKQSEVGTPDYSDLLLNDYISVIELANPMHSLWSDGRWNKLTMAHGCYWGKCTFCDISLDYIKIYEPITATLLADRMEEIIAQTGNNGFHFVDEAAPPALMKALALEILKRKLSVSWWTNIRFEKSFTKDLCVLLKASGCIAVSGGLEVASDRLLALIKKGVSVAQVAQVTQHFTEAGILVHAYLMYAYPTQSIQETIDSLEMVRQLFEAEVLQSGFWHQFALTAHSPVGMQPADYGITPHTQDISFAHNDVAFEDSTGIDHNLFSHGLKKSLFNYMHGIGLDFDLQEWFDFDIPATTISEDYIANCLVQTKDYYIKPNDKIVWLGALPQVEEIEGYDDYMLYIFHTKVQALEIELPKAQGKWFYTLLTQLTPQNKKKWSFAEIKDDFLQQFTEGFELFWYGEEIDALRSSALLLVV